MSSETKLVEDCIKELIKEFREFKDKSHDELRISRSKLDRLKFPLLDLYQQAFKQGVYVATWKGK